MAGSIDSYANSNIDNFVFLSAASSQFDKVYQVIYNPVDNYLSYASFNLSKFGTPGGNVIYRLYSISGTPGTTAIPDTLIASTGTYAANSLPNFSGSPPGGSDLKLQFSGTPFIAGGTYYALVIEVTGGDGTNAIIAGMDNSSPSHAGNSGYSVYSSGTWNAQTAVDYAFQLVGEYTTSHTVDSYLTSNAPPTQNYAGLIWYGGWGSGYSGTIYGGSMPVAQVFTFTKTHTVDSFLRGQYSPTHTSDSVLRKQVEPSHTISSVLRKTVDSTHTLNSLLRGQLSLTHTVSSSIANQYTTTHTVDANIKIGTGVLTGSVDATLRTTVSTTHTVSSVLKQSYQLTHTSDAMLRAQVAITHLVDLVLRKQVETTHTVDIILRRAVSITQTTDTVLRKTVTITNTVDSFLKAQRTVTHAIDSYLRNPSYTVSQSIDTRLRTVEYGTDTGIVEGSYSFIYVPGGQLTQTSPDSGNYPPGYNQSGDYTPSDHNTGDWQPS